MNIRSILVVPILKAKTVTGLVEVFSPQVDAFDASHVRWLIQLAQFIQAFSANAIRDVLNRVGTATWDEISNELGSRFEDSREPSKQAHDDIPRIGNQKSKWTALFWSR